MSDLASRARAAYRAGQYPSFTAAVRALYAQDLGEHTRPHSDCRTCGH